MTVRGRLGDPLTARENEALHLIVEGHNRESVSHQLSISRATAARHLANINRKLGAASALDVACWYYKKYWIPRSVASITVLSSDPNAGRLVREFVNKGTTLKPLEIVDDRNDNPAYAGWRDV